MLTDEKDSYNSDILFEKSNSILRVSKRSKEILKNEACQYLLLKNVNCGK